jgi:hypothetical protein
MRSPPSRRPRSICSTSTIPSGVATRARRRTQRLALGLHQAGFEGFEWWSTIEASWINVTLFGDRVTGRLSVIGELEPLTVNNPLVREAAEAVGVVLG